MFNTIDVDTNDDEVITRILNKILRCRSLLHYELRHSSHKGMHFILVCDRVCEVCRMVFDDPTRYEYDQFRPIASQNVLFSEYRQVKT